MTGRLPRDPPGINQINTAADGNGRRGDRVIPGISTRLTALRQDLFSVTDYPDGKLAEIIRDVGFACDCCTKCCTKEFNDHVFLLDSDTAAIKSIDPAALVPAPYFELCDQHGRFYDSGYALKTMPDGKCFFLNSNRCRIYESRLSICRIYPYMLHREPDEDGIVDWRQISGLNRHGTYHNEIPIEESLAIAREVKAYEAAFIEQTIRFYEFMCDHFAVHGLRHVRKTYDDRMRVYRKGEEIEVFVLFDGRLEPWRMRGDEAVPDISI
jgi:Fe-S-cluster containining protein